MGLKARRPPALAVPIFLLATGLGPPPPSDLATGAIAPRSGTVEPYAIRVTNRSQRAVTVYALRGGPPLRLGRVHPGQTAWLPASCSDFLSRETDFELRSVGGRFRLEGETIGDCGQTIEIEVLPIGLEFSRVRVIREVPPG